MLGRSPLVCWDSDAGASHMTKKLDCLVAVLSVVGASALIAQQSSTKAAEGTVTLDKKNYVLSQAVAFETTIDGEDAISVVLSRQAISSEKLKEARENDKQGGDTDFGRLRTTLIASSP